MKRKLVYRAALIILPFCLIFFYTYYDILGREWTVKAAAYAIAVSFYVSFAGATGTLLLIQSIRRKKLILFRGLDVLLFFVLVIPGSWLGYFYVFYWGWMTFVKQDVRYA